MKNRLRSNHESDRSQNHSPNDFLGIDVWATKFGNENKAVQSSQTTSPYSFGEYDYRFDRKASRSKLDPS